MATTLVIKGGAHIPSIVLDAKNNKFEFIGRSLPENAMRFYKPVMEWLDAFTTQASNQPTNFNFKLDYFNSSSVKQILGIFIRLQTAREKGIPVEITWLYQEDDLLMKSKGEELLRLVNVPSQVISYPDLD